MTQWTAIEVAGLKAFILQDKPMHTIYEAFSHRSIMSVQMKIREIKRDLREAQYKEKIALIQARNSTLTKLYKMYQIENRAIKKELKELKELSAPLSIKRLGHTIDIQVKKE